MEKEPETPLGGPPQREQEATGIFPAPGATEGGPPAPTEAKDETLWAADLELVQRTLAGDRGAGHEFVDRMVCIPRFLRRLDGRYGSPMGDDALTDLAQEVATRVWRDRGRFAGRSRLESWVFGYARRVYFEGIGSQQERSDLHVALDEGADQHADPGASVDDAVARDLDAQSILELIDELPARDAEVIREKLLGGAPFSAIARQRGEDINAVKTRYYRALERIRGQLQTDPREGDLSR